MPWNTPETWETDEVVTATKMQEQIYENISYLYERSWDQVIIDTSGTYSLSGTGGVGSSPADIDGTNLKLTITSSGRPIFVMASLRPYKTGDSQLVGFNFSDGTINFPPIGFRALGDNFYDAANTSVFLARALDLGSGTHNITLQYSAEAGTFNVSKSDPCIVFLGWEM